MTQLNRPTRHRRRMAAILLLAPMLAPVLAACNLNNGAGSADTKPVTTATAPATAKKAKAVSSQEFSQNALLQAKAGGAIALRRGEYRMAETMFGMALEIDPEDVDSLAGHAAALQFSKRPKEAEPILQKLLAVTRHGSARSHALALRMMAENAFALRQFKKAEEYFKQALQAYPSPGYETSQIDILGKLGGLAIESKRLGEARSYLNRAMDMARQHNSKKSQINIGIRISRLQRKSKQLVEAEKTLQQALRTAEEIGHEKFAATAIAHLGLVAREELQRKQAADYLNHAIDRFRKMKNGEDGLAFALSNLAHNYREQGKLARAEEIYKEANAVYRRINKPGSVAGNLLHLGQIAMKSTNLAAACGYWLESEKIFNQQGDKKAALLVSMMNRALCKGIGNNT